MDCMASKKATNSGHPCGSCAIGTDVDEALAGLNKKQAITKAKNDRPFRNVLNCWKPLPQRTPRHWSAANKITMIAASSLDCPASGGNRIPRYSPITTATADSLPQVESQSVHPITKPGYSPRAWRANV